MTKRHTRTHGEEGVLESVSIKIWGYFGNFLYKINLFFFLNGGAMTSAGATKKIRPWFRKCGRYFQESEVDHIYYVIKIIL